VRGRKAVAIDLTDRQRCCLEKIVSRAKNEKRLVTRASIVLDANRGLSNKEIAHQHRVTEKTVRTWRNRWSDATEPLLTIEEETQAQKPLAFAITKVLMDLPRRGTRPTFIPEQIVKIVAISLSSPGESGRPINCWSHRELADEAVSQGIVERCLSHQ
jgi:Homeodomain-like domain